MASVRGVQAEVGHQVGEQLRVDALRPSGAELVVLHGDHRSLRASCKTRDDPGVRIGFLEVIEGALGRVLAELPQLSSFLEERGGPVAVDGFHEKFRQRLFRLSGWADVGAERGQEAVLHLRPQPQPQQARLPLPLGVDAGEASVVEFVAEVERQLQIVPIRVRVRRRHPPRKRCPGGTGQGLADGAGEFAPAPRQRGAGGAIVGGRRGAGHAVRLFSRARWLVSHQG
jgi:hypothetical protein